jgi:uncharacterized protein
MWHWLANKIIRKKIFLVSVLVLLSMFMAFEAKKTELSYEFASILPNTDSSFIQYKRFKELFGQDGSVMVIGMKDDKVFELKTYNAWMDLGNDIKKIKGISNTMSIGNLYNVKFNEHEKKINFVQIVTNSIHSQELLDSVKKEIYSLPFYDGIIFNKKSNATLMAITFSKGELNSKDRIVIVNKIKTIANDFSVKQNIKLHYSGMPYIRTAIMEKVSYEMTLFLVLATIVMIAILWIFFKSLNVVFFSTLVVIIGVIWSVGIINLLGLKITILTGLIAPLIMVIGIPNCVFLINKYHNEFAKHNNKIKALSRTIETIGSTLFLANITTAIGFGVLYFTNSLVLIEFGVVASISVLVTYVITLILIPIILFYLPSPTPRHLVHLNAKRINFLLDFIIHIVQTKRKQVYIVISLVTIICLFGVSQINVLGYVVDDLPNNDPITNDLKFFETNFNGTLPFEIFIDFKKPNAIFSGNGSNLYKLNKLQKIFEKFPQFSKPVSIVQGIKFMYQGYKGGNSKYFVLPGASQLQALNQLSSLKNSTKSKLQNFIDTTKQFTRISYQVKDIGSIKTKLLLQQIKPLIDSVFNHKDATITLTGHSLMFLKGNDYLLENLLESLLIEILLITFVGIALFRSFKIIILSKLPCLIPLIITAGIMGYIGIRFKPSTILIFSIAFGISSDGTIYFLSKYRQELKKNLGNVSLVISNTIRETGISMIYTSLILFCGFAIFAASDFGGTIALGVLISITLLVSTCTNLILLPSILLSISNKTTNNDLIQEPFLNLDEGEG